MGLRKMVDYSQQNKQDFFWVAGLPCILRILPARRAPHPAYPVLFSVSKGEAFDLAVAGKTGDVLAGRIDEMGRSASV